MVAETVSRTQTCVSLSGTPRSSAALAKTTKRPSPLTLFRPTSEKLSPGDGNVPSPVGRLSRVVEFAPPANAGAWSANDSAAAMVRTPIDRPLQSDMGLLRARHRWHGACARRRRALRLEHLPLAVFHHRSTEDRAVLGRAAPEAHGDAALRRLV